LCIAHTQSLGCQPVLVELRDVQIRLPNRIEFKLVKGHQSRNLGGATWALSQEVRLNEEAEKLASAFIVNQERQRTPVEPERWPAQIVVLSDSNGSITGDLAKSIRTKMHSEAVQQYFQGKHDWGTVPIMHPSRQP
jgi:hypothetical protein